MPLSHKREFLARRLRDFGLLRVLERLGRRPGLVVLCYHRIGDPSADPYYGPLVSATPEGFRDQVRALRARFGVIGLEELIGRLDGDRLRLDGPTALITFDDGYRDNAEIAAPILRELGVPAAFFLTSSFLDGRLPWWDHVAAAVKRSPRDRLELERPERLEVELGDDRVGALAAVIAAYLRAERPDDPETLAHLDERAGLAIDGTARDLFMSWDDARRLAEGGMEVGAHTVSHRRLTTLGESEQSAELVESKRAIERAVGREVRALAYPYGDASAFDAGTIRLAREAGYRVALALRPGVVRPGMVEPMDLPRFNVMAADSPVLLRSRLALAMAVGRSAL
jgi:peptidoglycan/xylan/chitin deacetylase (PgdA/CDA1 family)